MSTNDIRPKRVHPSKQFTGWTIEELSNRENTLTENLSRALNLLGFDQKFGMPDHLIARYMVAAMWNLGYTLSKQIEEKEIKSRDDSIGLNTGFGSFMDEE